MSVASFIRRCVDSGLTYEQALIAADAMEVELSRAPRQRTKGAVRTARYRERERHKASQSVTCDDSDADDVTGVTTVTSDEGVSPKERSPRPPKEITPSPNPPSTPPGSHGSVTAEDSDFERFWSAYPEKVGKAAARTAFPKAITKISGPPLETILPALDRYKRTKPADRAYCNPATWLNQERWLDGIPTLAVAAADAVDPWIARVREFQRNLFWNRDWGPKPGEAACRATAKVLAEYGYPPGPRAVELSSDVAAA